MIIILLTWSPKRSLHYTLLNFKGVFQNGGSSRAGAAGGDPKKLKSFYSYVLHPTNYQMTRQPENECALEITEQGNTLCGDCLSPEEEDTCECCGKPYDDRSNHYLWELCDCVQNDDGTLSRPKEEDEESIPEVKDCGHFFDCGCGMTVCGECDDDMCDNEACAIYYTYRNDACMCDGCDFCEWKIRIRKSGLKLTPPFIPENQKNETNWNEDGDDELCSAIDASGNALY